MPIQPGYILAKQKILKGKKPFSSKQVHSAAQALGKQGGLQGGPARAEALSDNLRREIASHAANIRWNRPCNCRYCK